MAKGCKKCDPHDICEECPEWIFTLADLIMCMMGLFVILWVLKPSVAPKPASSATADEQTKVLAAIRDAFGYVPDPLSSDPIDQELLKKVQKMKMNGPGENGNSTMKPNGAEGTEREVTSIRPGKIATTGGKLDFDRGSEALRPATLKELQAVSKIIIGHRNIVVVKGHSSLDDFTDGARPEERMAMSVRRAQAVADYLVTIGVAPDCLRVQGCSTFEPVKERAYTEADQQLNRRVEVEASANLIPEFQDKSPATRPPSGN